MHKITQINRTARFWETTPNCGLVKISIRPGQTLTHSRRWRNGEGWSWSAETYTHDGDCIRQQWAHGGRDCDGNHCNAGELVASLDELAAVDIYSHPGFRRPNWQESKRESVYDQFAQAAGY